MLPSCLRLAISDRISAAMIIAVPKPPPSAMRPSEKRPALAMSFALGSKIRITPGGREVGPGANACVGTVPPVGGNGATGQSAPSPTASRSCCVSPARSAQVGPIVRGSFDWSGRERGKRRNISKMVPKGVITSGIYFLRILRSLAMCRFAAALPFTSLCGFFLRTALLRRARGLAARRFAGFRDFARFFRVVFLRVRVRVPSRLCVAMVCAANPAKPPGGINGILLVGIFSSFEVLLV